MHKLVANLEPLKLTPTDPIQATAAPGTAFPSIPTPFPAFFFLAAFRLPSASSMINSGTITSTYFQTSPFLSAFISPQGLSSATRQDRALFSSFSIRTASSGGERGREMTSVGGGVPGSAGLEVEDGRVKVVVSVALPFPPFPRVRTFRPRS
jgi:hypothetical protein